MTRIHELQNTRGKELSGIEITAYFLTTRVQPLQARKNPFWKYTGEKDVDMLSKDLPLKDFEKLIRKISSLNDTSPTFHVGAGIPGVAPHYIPPPSTFNVLLGSYWFDNLGFILEGNLPLTNIDPNNVPLASLVAQEEHVDEFTPGLEAMLKEFISTQTAFNKSVEEKLGKIDILASKVDSLAADVDLLKLKVMPNENHHNKIVTTANAIQVRINENIRLMAELRARWDREENEKLAKEKNVAKVWTITTTNNANATHVAAPPTNNNKRIGVSNVSTSNAKREKLPETAKTAETACDKAAEIFSNIGDDDPIALDYNGLNFDDCHISEVIKFLQKLAKSPNASAINLAFTQHITNALIKAREEKLEREVSIPRKLEDGWEPIIKMKVKDFDCNALCDLGASISVMPKKIYDMLDLPPLKNCYLDVNLADHSTKKPLGKVDNVRITVNNNLVPVDFVVLDIECNASCPIILGRPFLRTVGAIIDMKEGSTLAPESLVLRRTTSRRHQPSTCFLAPTGSITLVSYRGKLAANHPVLASLPPLPEDGEVEDRTVVDDDNQGTSRPASEVAGSHKFAASAESEATASTHSPPPASPKNKRKRSEVKDSGTSNAEETDPSDRKAAFNPYTDALVSSDDEEEEQPIDAAARTSTSCTLVVSETQRDGEETSPPQQNVEHSTPPASPRASSPKRARVEPSKEPILFPGNSSTPSLDDPLMKEFIRLGTQFVGYRDHSKKLEGQLAEANKRANALVAKLEQSEKARIKAEADAAAVEDLRRTHQNYEVDGPVGDELLDAPTRLEIHGDEARDGLADAEAGLSKLFPYFFPKKEEPNTFVALAKAFNVPKDLGLKLRQEGLKIGVEGTIALIADSQQNVDWPKLAT
ncbi:hypothetical protein QYE76_038893 [Lolium multiflorum]|uniref:Uncharacterized protein n=1 Tax=Lolium multiflorum TaxID=4521 RepID=A0AAD8WRP8_LOLMU|nr:hypothetical protein QYE76_038893 [Lolium multiflorum]